MPPSLHVRRWCFLHLLNTFSRLGVTSGGEILGPRIVAPTCWLVLLADLLVLVRVYLPCLTQSYAPVPYRVLVLGRKWLWAPVHS